MVLLNLHKGYKLPGGGNHKFTQQRVGPFKVLERIGNLAYRLELPPRWSIHPVISIAHLSPMPAGDDPFQRALPSLPEIIEVDGDSDEWKSYELDRILDKRFTKYHQRDNLEYLVKFKGLGNEHNDWYPIELLQNAMDMVRSFEASLPRRRRTDLGQFISLPVPTPQPTSLETSLTPPSLPQDSSLPQDLSSPEIPPIDLQPPHPQPVPTSPPPTLTPHSPEHPQPASTTEPTWERSNRSSRTRQIRLPARFRD